ncbi:MAG: hypothetical protein U1D67_06735 [Dehalococcoidia bacterium]|nr:hypothetical protein [Dehalococcoidia bacterium]
MEDWREILNKTRRAAPAPLPEEIELAGRAAKWGIGLWNEAGDVSIPLSREEAVAAVARGFNRLTSPVSSARPAVPEVRAACEACGDRVRPQDLEDGLCPSCREGIAEGE